MPVIEIETRIHAPIQMVFDLSRSIDLHVESTAETKEEAVPEEGAKETPQENDSEENDPQDKEK